MGKVFKKKPYFFIGKRSLIGLGLNLLILFLIENQNFNNSTLFYIIIIFLIICMTYFYVTDFRNYKRLH